MQWAVLVHGGAGEWQPKDEAAAVGGTTAAVRTAADILAKSGTALDAVVAAVVALEDDPLFNAGTGAALNRDGDVEMDASVMCGHDLRCGAVAGLRRVRNPVLVAWHVMERTPHVMLAGEGALRFARGEGFADYDPLTQRARDAWLRKRASAYGTVGAVALDRHGRLAAATSTGGVTLKLPGRIGDSPIPGAGNYAHAAAACSATGHGELMMRLVAAKDLCDRVAHGEHPQAAAEALLREMAASVGAEAGFILLSRAGGLGVAHRTASMPHAWWREGDPAPSARVRC
ncbi:MAG TPA: isoaspartyl peptidase/L-asparaginase family protein [Steroidobacteraceae bacterium]|nr:isoaspartyl peptidase/L-asparaginase family protein [Steroidobacteraceae bacterium]